MKRPKVNVHEYPKTLMGVFYEDRQAAFEYAWSLIQEGHQGVAAERVQGNWQVTKITKQ